MTDPDRDGLTIFGRSQGRDIAIGEHDQFVGAALHPKAVSERLGHSSISITMDRKGIV
jgi:hypothetical protein